MAARTGRAPARGLSRYAYTVGLGIYYIVLGLGVPYLLVSLLAGTSHPANTPAPANVDLLWTSVKIGIPNPEVFLGLLAYLGGALGAIFYGINWYVWFMAHRVFEPSWNWWHYLRPVLGGALALIVYLVFRAGFLSINGSSGGPDVNPFVITGVSGIVGMFAKEASGKLAEVAETLFKPRDGDADVVDLKLSSSKITLREGSKSTEPIEVTAGRAEDFFGDLQLQALGLPSGLTASFEPAVLCDDATTSRLSFEATDFQQAHETSGGEIAVTVIAAFNARGTSRSKGLTLLLRRADAGASHPGEDEG